MKKLLTLVLALVLSVGAFTACGGETANDDIGFKFGLICLHDSSSTYDKNFIDAANAAVEKAGLTKDQFVLKTGINEDTTCYDAAADLVDEGCDVIFADSFGHEAHMLNAAKEFKDVEFCHATGVNAHTANLPNFHNAFASIYEGRYLAGVVAGMKINEMIENGTEINGQVVTTETAKMGYVGAFTYAEVVSGYTSFYLGAKSVCPTVTMDVQFTGAWYDVSAEANAANALISRGCCLISQHADSMGAPNACKEKGVPNIAYNVSTKDACPDTYLTASRINWEPYFTYIINQTMGKLKAKKADANADVSEFAIPADWTGTVETGSVELLDLGAKIAAGTEAKLEEVKANLANGSLKVFDVNTFKVTTKNDYVTVNEDGILTSYMANVDDDKEMVGDTEVVENGAFLESAKRSAPYFDLEIEGITRLNVEF